MPSNPDSLHRKTDHGPMSTRPRAQAEGLKKRGQDGPCHKLFELGRLFWGQAAALAGVPRVTFLLNCHRFGTPEVTWDQEEIEAEKAC